MRALLLAIAALLVLPVAASAQIRALPLEPPQVVALGDSAISGEAGRWAGNTNGASSRTHAHGSTPYHHIPGAESIPGCHQSKAAQGPAVDGRGQRPGVRRPPVPTRAGPLAS